MKPRLLAAALLLSLAPASAWAQDDATTTQARTRFKEGVESFDKGRYEEARLAFLQAYALKKHPAVLLNLAQSSAKSNHPLEAAKYFQQFLRESTTATPAQKRDAEAGLYEARQKLGRIEIVAPAGTEIALDEQGKVGTTPMDALDVDPGQHTLKSPTQSVTVIAVIGQKVEAKFGPTPGSIPPGPPVFPTQPTETLQPATTDTLPPARHSASLLSRPENMTPVYVGLGVGAAGIASAIVFAIFRADAQSKADEVANNIRSEAIRRHGADAAQGICKNAARPEFQPACKTLEDNNDKVDLNATIANVSMIVGAAGLVFAGVWYLGATKHDDVQPTGAARAPKRPTLAPYAGANGGGFVLGGEF